MAAYATGSDLGQLSVIPSDVLAQITTGTQDAALDAASRDADGYLASRYKLPLTAWGTDLRQRVCDIAAYRLMGRLGYDPNGADSDIRDRYDDALSWLERVGRGVITPDVVTTAPATTVRARVLSADPRGW